MPLLLLVDFTMERRKAGNGSVDSTLSFLFSPVAPDGFLS